MKFSIILITLLSQLTIAGPGIGGSSGGGMHILATHENRGNPVIPIINGQPIITPILLNDRPVEYYVNQMQAAMGSMRQSNTRYQNQRVSLDQVKDIMFTSGEVMYKSDILKNIKMFNFKVSTPIKHVSPLTYKPSSAELLGFSNLGKTEVVNYDLTPSSFYRAQKNPSLIFDPSKVLYNGETVEQIQLIDGTIIEIKKND